MVTGKRDIWDFFQMLCVICEREETNEKSFREIVDLSIDYERIDERTHEKFLKAMLKYEWIRFKHPKLDAHRKLNETNNPMFIVNLEAMYQNPYIEGLKQEAKKRGEEHIS